MPHRVLAPLGIEHRQSGIGWCTALLLANIFHERGFLRYVGDPDFRACHDEHVEHMLINTVPDLKLSQVAYADPSHPRLPIDYVWALTGFGSPGEEIDAVPITAYVLTVRLIELSTETMSDQLWHSVAVLSHGGIRYYLDPYNTEIFELKDAAHLGKQFIDCAAVNRFSMRGSDNWAYIIGKNTGWSSMPAKQ